MLCHRCGGVLVAPKNLLKGEGISRKIPNGRIYVPATNKVEQRKLECKSCGIHINVKDQNVKTSDGDVLTIGGHGDLLTSKFK